MYKVEIKHLKPIIRKGDLENTLELVNVLNFKTKKEAKIYIEDKLKRHKNVYRAYFTGTKPSQCAYFLDNKWINENSGEEFQEAVYFILTKI